MSVINATAAAIYSKLQAGTALTALLSGTTAIYHMQAPDGATLPYVVYNHQAGGPENITPSDMNNDIWQVRSYSDVSAATAGNIDAQVDVLMHGGSLTVTGYTNFWCKRMTNVVLVENTPNGQIWSCGGLYRIRLDD